MCVNVYVWVKKWEGETGLTGPAKGGGLGVAQHLLLRVEWRQKNSFTSPLYDSSRERQKVCTEKFVEVKDKQK